MLLELITTYYLMNTDPIYLQTQGCPCATMYVGLHLNKEFLNNYYFDIQPYFLRDITDDISGRAGAEVSLGYKWKSFDLSLYHHSSHNLDTYLGRSLEMDAITLKINLLP